MVLRANLHTRKHVTISRLASVRVTPVSSFTPRCTRGRRREEEGSKPAGMAQTVLLTAVPEAVIAPAVGTVGTVVVTMRP